MLPFNHPKLLSPYTDSLLLRTNFFLAKEKSDYRNLSQHLNRNHTQEMIFFPNLSMVKGPLAGRCFGLTFLHFRLNPGTLNLSKK